MDGAHAKYGVSTKWNAADNHNAYEVAAVYHNTATKIRKMSNPKVYDALMSLYEEVKGCGQDIKKYVQYVCMKVKDYTYEALGNFKRKKRVTPVTDRASGRIAKVMDTLIAQLKVGFIFAHNFKFTCG